MGSEEMNRDEYRFLYELEGDHWWFAGMREIIAALLDPLVASSPLRILDAGCGTGFTLSWLKKKYARSGQVVGLDISPDALELSRRRAIMPLIQASVAQIPLPSNTFDLIVSFEVLD